MGVTTRRPEEPYTNSVRTVLWEPGRVTAPATRAPLWHTAYRQLARPLPGVLGQITARAEAHTIRLALLYTLADGAKQIGPQHLDAALALHDYAARSAAWALTGATGQPLAEQIHTALTAHPAGLTRSQISDTLKHNQPAGEIDHALRVEFPRLWVCPRKCVGMNERRCHAFNQGIYSCSSECLDTVGRRRRAARRAAGAPL